MSDIAGMRKALEFVSSSQDRERIQEEITLAAWRSGHSENCHSILYDDWCECYGPPRVPDCPHVAKYDVCEICRGVKRGWDE